MTDVTVPCACPISGCLTPPGVATVAGFGLPPTFSGMDGWAWIGAARGWVCPACQSHLAAAAALQPLATPDQEPT